MKCKYCQAEIEQDAMFCTNCGKDLSKFPRCVKCGEILDEDSEFCPYCGTKQPKEEPILNEEEPKRSKKWLWIVGCLALLILIIGGALLYFNRSSETSENGLAQDSIPVVEKTENGVKENIFKEINKKDVWVKAADEYKIIYINIDWPENLEVGDVKTLQDKLSMEGFGFKGLSIDEAITKYISSIGTPIKTPELSPDDRDYNGCEVTDVCLEIKKVAFEQGKFITFYVQKNEAPHFSSAYPGDYDYFTYDLKESKFLTKSDIIKNFSPTNAELMDIVKSNIRKEDIDVLTFSDADGINNLDLSNDIYVGDKSVVFTFTGYHNYEVKVPIFYKEISDFITNRIYEYFKEYN